MTELLEVCDLHTVIHRRRSVVRAVEGVCLTVGAGETVGLVGESGCGKTMIGKSIMGLLPPGGRIESGSIHLDGVDLTALRETEMRRIRGNDIALVFQDPMTSLNPTMTIGNQIAEHVRIHRGWTRAQAQQRALEVLALVGIPRPAERLNSYPHQLSGGLRQRVVIAIALACEPKLLIADEPTTALDVTIQRQILALLDDLKGQLGMGLLLITHDMGVIAGRADRVVVMYAGKIAEAAETAELFDNRHHPYTAALLESIPRLDHDPSTPLYTIPGLPPNLVNPPAGCRFAPRCAHARPDCLAANPLMTVDGGHAFACFHPLGGANAAFVGRAPRRVDAVSATPSTNHVAQRPPLLVVDHLVKEFPVTRGLLQKRVGSIKAVSDVSFTVNRGETFGLVGESGSGKTTLGRLITAHERPDSGSITFNGTDIAEQRGGKLRRLRRDLQLIFQDPYASLDPRMRIGPALREPMIVQHMGTRGLQQEQVSRLLKEVGLGQSSVELYPHEFSGGQRQRIGFARALTIDPKLIVADEPVSALDVSIRSQILNLMKSLQCSHDLTYIVISHDLSVVRYLADRIAVMYLGKLVEIGPSDLVYAGPSHPYTAGLLDSIPLVDPAQERTKQGSGVRGEPPSALDPPSGCRFRTRCPHAQARCAEEEPMMRAFGSEHFAACHFPLRVPLEVPVELASR